MPRDFHQPEVEGVADFHWSDWRQMPGMGRRMRTSPMKWGTEDSSAASVRLGSSLDIDCFPLVGTSSEFDQGTSHTVHS